MTLEDLGWTPGWAESFAPWAAQGCAPARVSMPHRLGYRLLLPGGEVEGVLPGRARHVARNRAELPAVGDWVAVSPETGTRLVIRGVLPRRSKFSRKLAGETTGEQVVAANIDMVFVTTALDNDFNPRRVERYLALAWEGGVPPVILLTKSDLAEALDDRVAEMTEVAPGVPVQAISLVTGAGLDALEPYLKPGRTIALLGSSGVGKSSLINRLMGRDVLRTGAVRASDQRGRHITSHRQLLVLPGGALVIDSPGMRELQLWKSDEGVRETFDDVESLGQACRFANCQHLTEPDCAVRRAVDQGGLSPARVENYRRLQAELTYLQTKQDVQARLEQKRKWKAIHKVQRNFKPRE